MLYALVDHGLGSGELDSQGLQRVQIWEPPSHGLRDLSRRPLLSSWIEDQPAPVAHGCRLANCGNIISAQQNFRGLHVWNKPGLSGPCG